MPSGKELEFRVSETAQLLEAGIKPSHVQTIVHSQFHAPPRNLDKAEETMNDDDGPALEESDRSKPQLQHHPSTGDSCRRTTSRQSAQLMKTGARLRQAMERSNQAMSG